ncbi:MAG TPA: transposase, partial [Propionibacteriaceae bacterium]
FRDDQGGWRRVEPWMSTIVNADCAQVLGIVHGRDSAAVGVWLAERSRAWRDRIEVVAIDPSAAFKKAITDALPNAKISVDPFHLVQLANLMVTRVRQRLIREPEHRRGRKVDPAWANRRLLLRGYDTSRRGRRPGSMLCSPATTPPTSCPQPGALRNNSGGSSTSLPSSRPTPRR